MMRIFLDANILFSAAQSNSRMRVFLEALKRRGTCLTNFYAIDEARRNLEKKAPAALGALDVLITECELVSGLVLELEVELKLKDVPILAGAIAGRASHLLTGDEKDFGKFFGKIIQSVKIVSPKLLAEELVKEGFI